MSVNIFESRVISPGVWLRMTGLFSRSFNHNRPQMTVSIWCYIHVIPYITSIYGIYITANWYSHLWNIHIENESNKLWSNIWENLNKTVYRQKTLKLSLTMEFWIIFLCQRLYNLWFILNDVHKLKTKGFSFFNSTRRTQTAASSIF